MQIEHLEKLERENKNSPNDPWSGGKPGPSNWLRGWINEMRGNVNN